LARNKIAKSPWGGGGEQDEEVQDRWRYLKVEGCAKKSTAGNQSPG